MRALPSSGYFCVAFIWVAMPAQADVRSYCEAYARNQADEHLSGGAIFGSRPEFAAGERQERERLALTDCLALYAPKPNNKIAATEAEIAAPIPVPRIKPKEIRAKATTPPAPRIEAATAAAPAEKKQSAAGAASPVPGSAAWKDYCAARYASYNPATDTFTSFSGKQRPCRATGETAPVTRTKAPALAAKRQLPARAAKSEPPAAASVKSPWDSFDNPRLPTSR